MEAINIFLEKELEFKMFDRQINNIYYWEYIRPIVSCEVNSVVSKSSAMFAKNKFNFKKYLLNIKNIKKYFLLNRKADILIVSQPRRVKSNGNFKNNYTDYYVDYLKDKYDILTIEEPTWSSLGISKTAHDFPLHTNNIFLTDLHELKMFFKIKLFKFFSRKKFKTIVKEYNEVNKIVNSWYNLNEINFKKYFINSLIRIHIDQKYIRKLIKKINPKIVMLHYFPTVFKQMMIDECNKKNIKTIEIQHGTITKIDPLVNKCLNVKKLKIDTKYIFSFGDLQVNKYALSIKNINNLKVIGFPFFEETLKNLKSQKKKNILIISQSTIGDEMANFTEKLSGLLINDDIKIIFKYHPNEYSKDYQCLKKDNIIEIRNEKTIYDIQNESLLQIGSYSTSLYEGFAMGIPTLIIRTMFGSIETIDIFENIKKGVYFIDKPSDVLEYISKKDILPKKDDINKLWAKNSKKNLLLNIKKIMKEEV